MEASFNMAKNSYRIAEPRRVAYNAVRDLRGPDGRLRHLVAITQPNVNLPDGVEDARVSA